MVRRKRVRSARTAVKYNRAIELHFRLGIQSIHAERCIPAHLAITQNGEVCSAIHVWYDHMYEKDHAY